MYNTHKQQLPASSTWLAGNNCCSEIQTLVGTKTTLIISELAHSDESGGDLSPIGQRQCYPLVEALLIPKGKVGCN
jgi:hypothetical protein